jgi:hypothetical protein
VSKYTVEVTRIANDTEIWFNNYFPDYTSALTYAEECLKSTFTTMANIRYYDDIKDVWCMCDILDNKTVFFRE